MIVAPYNKSASATQNDTDIAAFTRPDTRGLTALQARLVDRIKRAAIRHLHASARGERLLLLSLIHI